MVWDGKKLPRILQGTAMILGGNLLVAFLVRAFISPHGIIMAGSTGISLALTRIVPLDTAAVVLVVNVLLLLLGLLLLGKAFFLATVVSSLVYPAFLALMEQIPGLDQLTDNSLLAALFAGALLGVALGMVLRVGASTGGTDVISLVLHKWFHIPVSACVWTVDILVLLGQMAYANPEQIMYGILVLAIETLVLNQVMLFGQAQVQILVISPHYEQLRAKLLVELQAGVTMLLVETGCTGAAQKGVLCILPPRKLFAARQLIDAVDPNAFFTITRVREVQGQGFSSARRANQTQLQQWSDRCEKGEPE